MVVLLGIDVHETMHTTVAVDAVGQKIGQATVAATDAGHRQLLEWALHRWPAERLRFAVEDCRQVSTRLERTLLAAGQTVIRVPPRLTVGVRSSARTRGKSDLIDALAIARVALREPDLPTATLDGPIREIRLLVDHREDLVAARTQMQNRLRWHLHELEPGQEPGLRCLDRYCELDRLAAWLASCKQSVLVRLASELVRDIRAHTVRINALRTELAERVVPLAPRLLALPGCGVLITAKILGEVGRIDRSARRAALRCTLALRRSRPRRARPPATDWPAAETDNSTPHCTASQSARSAPAARAASSNSDDAQAAIPLWKPYARSNAASLASSTAYSARSQRPPRPPPRREPTRALLLSFIPLTWHRPTARRTGCSPSMGLPADLVQLCARGDVW